MFVHVQGPVSKYMGTPEEAAALKEQAGHEVDLEALAQAHVNALTGACLALGIKYAGSSSPAARLTLTSMVRYMLEAKNAAPDSSGGKRLIPSAVLISRAVMCAMMSALWEVCEAVIMQWGMSAC